MEPVNMAERLAAIEQQLAKLKELLTLIVPREAIPQHLWTPQRQAQEAIRQAYLGRATQR